MNVLIDARHMARANQSGVGQYTSGLLRALFEIDHDDEFIVFTSGKTKPKLENIIAGYPNVKHAHVSVPNKLLNLRTFILKSPTINQLAGFKTDLIFLPNINIAILPNDIPTVMTIHDLSWKLYPEFYTKKMLLWHNAAHPCNLIAQSKKIICPSESTAEDLERDFSTPRDKIAIIHHGVDEDMSAVMNARDHGVRSRLKLPKRFALFVGTIEPRKNLIALIEGMIDYRNRSRDDLHLVIAGAQGWKTHALRRRLWKRDTQGWVHELGYVAREDLPALYRSSAVFTWPSIYEGFGLPPLEAAACGVPIVSSFTSSMPEVLGDAAVYIDPYNGRDISDALNGLMSSSSLISTLKQRGLERAKDFTWKKTAQETLDVFRSCAAIR